MPKLPYEAALSRQQIAVALVRAGAIICVLWGLAHMAQWVIEGVTQGDLGDIAAYAWVVANGAMLLLAGAAAALWSRRIARLLLGPPAVDLCPGCDYQLPEAADRCPECGLEFLAAIAPPDRLSAQDVLVRRRHLLRALIRLAILYILVITIWHFGAGMVSVASTLAHPEYDDVRTSWIVSYSANLAVGLVAAGILRLLERPLILWLTPVAPTAEGNEPPPAE